jgi:acyl carrier protein|tara:strand:- start:3413 stop:3637 length:225 start_codon:yes stop_codon:yes gene_type:complete
MKEIIDILEKHFGTDTPITPESHMIDDLNGDDFDVVDVVCQIEEALGITIPEEETMGLGTVQELITVVSAHVES